MLHGIFHTDAEFVLLLEIWKIHSTKALIFACVIVAVFAMVYQGTKFLLNFMEYEDLISANLRRRDVRCLSSRRVAETALHVLHVVCGYSLMLVVMSFNVWIFVSAVTGLSLGFFIYGWTKHSPLSRPKQNSNRVSTLASTPSVHRGLQINSHKTRFMSLLDTDIDVTEV